MTKLRHVLNALEKAMTDVRNVLFALAAFGVIGFVIVALLVPSAKRGDLVLEVAKACIQLLLATLVGVGISELVKDRDSRRANADKEAAQDRDSRRAQAEKEAAQVMRIRRAVTKAYLNSKRTRRCLRADATKTAPKQYADIALRPYGRHMRAVNDAQLELERLVRELEKDVTSLKPEWLEEAISSMKSMEHEKYGKISWTSNKRIRKILFISRVCASTASKVVSVHTSSVRGQCVSEGVL
jgi:hypothetical protein